MARNIVVTRVARSAQVVKSTPLVVAPDADNTVNVTQTGTHVVNNFVLVPGPKGDPGAPGSPGAPGAPGPADPNLLVVHEQTTPAATWSIQHVFGRLPIVTVYINGEDVLVPVEATTMSVTITLPSPRAGVAVLR